MTAMALRTPFAALTLLSLLSASSALAQEDPTDWTLVKDPQSQTVMATIEFSTGLQFAARCQAGVYDLVVAGLPEAPRDMFVRNLTIKAGEDGDLNSTAWTVGTQRSHAFSRVPVRVARDLAEGGQLELVSPGLTEGAPRTRYIMDIAPSSGAIAETLSACNKPLEDPRDQEAEDVHGDGGDGLPSSVIWARAPRPQYPAPVGGRLPSNGYVVLSCLSRADGSLERCEIESEQPVGYRLGQSALASIGRSRIKLTPTGEAAGTGLASHLILFSINFRMER